MANHNNVCANFKIVTCMLEAYAQEIAAADLKSALVGELCSRLQLFECMHEHNSATKPEIKEDSLVPR